MSKLRTLKVNEEVWKEVKVTAAKLGISICDYVADAITDYNKKLEKEGKLQ